MGSEAWRDGPTREIAPVNDTSPEFERMYQERLMALSGEERLRMGADMFDTAVALMRAGIAAQSDRSLSEVEIRERLLERLYGNDFSPKVRRRSARRGARACGLV